MSFGALSILLPSFYKTNLFLISGFIDQGTGFLSYSRMNVPRSLWKFVSAKFIVIGSLIEATLVGTDISSNDAVSIVDLSRLVVTSLFIGLGYGTAWTGIPVLVNEGQSVFKPRGSRKRK